MDPWKNGVSVLPVRLGPPKSWCHETPAVYEKGSQGLRRKSQTPEEPGNPYGRATGRERDTAAFRGPERRREALNGGHLLHSGKGGLSGVGGHERRPGRGGIFHRLFRGL